LPLTTTAPPARTAPATALVVVGDVMTDVVVRPLGPHAPASDTPAAIAVTPGGAGANPAGAAAAGAAGGVEVHLVAATGADQQGRAAAGALAAAGVHAHLAASDRPTGTVVSIVDRSGQRSMLSDRGANLDLDEAALAAAPFRPGAHLHLCGYVLLDEATRPAGLAALRRARAAGMTASVDPSSAAPLARAGAAAFLAWTAGAEWCCANLDEGRTLTGAFEPEDVAFALRRFFPEVVLTLGAGGVLHAAGAGRPVPYPAAAGPVADTTGAGDAFTGTWLARRLAGDAPGTAVGVALAAAARAVATVGAGWAQSGR
jgi:sugar/nucleoside kinase (ribokinase family)